LDFWVIFRINLFLGLFGPLSAPFSTLSSCQALPTGFLVVISFIEIPTNPPPPACRLFSVYLFRKVWPQSLSHPPRIAVFCFFSIIRYFWALVIPNPTAPFVVGLFSPHLKRVLFNFFPPPCQCDSLFFFTWLTPLVFRFPI